MSLKARVLLPGGILAAAVLATACVPPPAPPGTTTTTTTTTTVKPGGTTTTTTTTTTTLPPAPACPATPSSSPGPDSQNPINSWGLDVNGANNNPGSHKALATVVIGDIVYVGGLFTEATAPTGSGSAPRSNLAAFCLANGSLLTTFVADFAGGEVDALATDGTNLFVGGDFTTLGGQPVNRLVKLNATTGERIAAFNPAAIPDVVYALDVFGSQVYVGGDFDIAGTGGKKGANFDTTTGARGAWEPNVDNPTPGVPDGHIRSLKVSPDGASVFVGGNFDFVSGQPHNDLARTQASNGTAAATQYGENNNVPGLVEGVPFSLAVDADNVTLYAAIGPADPGGSHGGNKFIAYNSDGTERWSENGPDGDAQAIVRIGSELYGGFHGGWDAPNNFRLVGLNIANGTETSFMPVSNGALGVRGLAAGSNRMVAVGDFTQMGNNNKVSGLAIFA